MFLIRNILNIKINYKKTVHINTVYTAVMIESTKCFKITYYIDQITETNSLVFD